MAVWDGGELMRLCAQEGGGKARKTDIGKARVESREIQCHQFMVVFQNNTPAFEHLDGIDVKFAESCVGFGGYHYVFLRTKTKIRPAQLENAINTYNEHVPASKTAVLTCIDGYKSVITFDRKSGKYTKHALYKFISEEKIKSQRQLPSTYRAWRPASASGCEDEVHVDTSSEEEQVPPSVTLGKRRADGQDRPGEYDVVKKQRTINNANAMVGADITSVLLGEEAGYFYDFSNSVLQALTAVSNLEGVIFNEEARWMQHDQQCNARTKIGYAYAAFNTCLGDPAPIKMGATMKNSPFHRLKELSRCLPQSFELLACVPSTDPFAVEKLVHAHFEQFRIKRRSTGRTTEFFMVSKDVVCKFFADLNQELLLPA